MTQISRPCNNPLQGHLKHKENALRHHPHLHFFSEKKSRDFPIFFKDAPFYKIDFIFHSANYSRITKIAKSQNRDEKNAGVDDAINNRSC